MNIIKEINPYIAGNPLRGSKGFFGRQDILKWVEDELRNPNTQSLVLNGQRRIGKTSLLLQLKNSLPAETYFPVYFDLQDQTNLSLGEVLANLADTAAEEIEELPPVDMQKFDNRGYFFRRHFLPQLYRVLGRNRRPVFLLDEFDVMDTMNEKFLPEAIAIKEFHPFLRRLMLKEPRPAFVFVVGRRAEDLSMNLGATFKTSLVKEVWTLDRDSAEALVRQAEVNNTLRFTGEAIHRILKLTNNHPYLTQLLCQRIWERVVRRAPVSKPPIVDVETVEATTYDVLEVGHQALDWAWNGLSPAEKTFAAALAQSSEEGKIIPEEHIIEVLSNHAGRVRTSGVNLVAPRDLVKRRVLIQANSKGYHFAIELFRRWVKQNKPLNQVKQDLDQRNPLAEQIFTTGERYFQQRKWRDAAKYFEDALKENPDHLRAQLYLARTQMEMGKVNLAVALLEKVHDIDQQAAHSALIQALIAQAEKFEKSDKLGEALDAVERVLEISAEDEIARQLKSMILHRQGDKAQEQGDLVAALDAYQRAGAADKADQVLRKQQVQQIEVEKQKSEKEELYHDALSAFNKQDWIQAITKFLVLIEGDPDYRDTTRKLTEAQRHLKTQILYTQAKGHFQRENWPAAKSELQEVVKRDPQFEDAQDMLEKVKTRIELQQLYEKAQAYIQVQDWKSATELLQKIQTIEPDYKDSKARLQLAEEEFRLDNLYHKAQLAFEHDPSNAEIYFEDILKVRPKYRDVVDKLEAVRKRKEITRLYYDALDYARKKDWAAAVSAFQEVLSLDPFFPEADEKLKDAQKQLDLEQELEPLYEQAITQLDRGHETAAKSFFHQIQELNPSYRKEEIERHLLYLKEDRKKLWSFPTISARPSIRIVLSAVVLLFIFGSVYFIGPQNLIELFTGQNQTANLSQCLSTAEVTLLVTNDSQYDEKAFTSEVPIVELNREDAQFKINLELPALPACSDLTENIAYEWDSPSNSLSVDSLDPSRATYTPPSEHNTDPVTVQIKIGEENRIDYAFIVSFVEER